MGSGINVTVNADGRYWLQLKAEDAVGNQFVNSIGLELGARHHRPVLVCGGPSASRVPGAHL